MKQNEKKQVSFLVKIGCIFNIVWSLITSLIIITSFIHILFFDSFQKQLSNFNLQNLSINIARNILIFYIFIYISLIILYIRVFIRVFTGMATSKTKILSGVISILFCLLLVSNDIFIAILYFLSGLFILIGEYE